MSINKALVIVFCILGLLVVFTAINLNRSKSVPSSENEFIDDGVLMMNIQCVPEIVRSFERVREVYGKKNILVFRFARNSCNNCLDSQLNELLSFQEEIGKERVWVFPAYPDDRNCI